MALPERALTVRFRGGVDTKSDSKTVANTQLLALENGVFVRAGSIKKRNGYESLSRAIEGSASEVTGAIRTGVRDQELLQFTPDRSYSRQSGADQWSDVGSVYSVIGTDRPLGRTGTQQLQPDQATQGNITVAAWEDSAGGVWWSVQDTNGRVLKSATQADASGTRPRCLAVGAVLHVYYAVAASRQIWVLVVDPSLPSAAVTPALLVDDLHSANAAYDACATTRAGSPAAIAWQEHATTNIRLGYVDASGALGGPATGHPIILTRAANMDPASPLAIGFGLVDGGTGDWLALSYAQPAGGSTVTYFHGGSSVSPIAFVDSTGGPTTLDPLRTTVTIVDSQALTATVWAAWELDAAEPSERRTAIAGFDVVDGAFADFTVRSVGLASRAFVVDGVPFAAFVHDTTYFNTYVTLRLTDGLAVGRHVPAEASGAPARNILPSAHVDGDTATIALPVRERLTSENNDRFRETGLRLFSLDFASEDSHQTVQLGRGLYLAGACPQRYDGRTWTEQGFHFGPELIAGSPAAGGSMTASVVYKYVAWYEATDTQGEVDRGPVSIGTLVTLGGGDSQVTLTLPTLRLTGKHNVRICVGRSRAAETGKTAEMFRVTSLDPTTDGSPNGYVANDPTVDSVTFVDRMSDDDLEDEEPVYTDGGILSNDPVALGSVIARGKRRLFATDPSNGLLIRFSQPIAEGYSVEWPPDLVHEVDPFGGDITALAVQDDRIVAFKASAIFVFAGDGPQPNGDTSTSGFTEPQLVTSDVGCTDPSSIVLTPNGLMFKSAKGIYLLDRSGSVVYVGAAVEAFNAQAVRRGTVMPDRTQVVFLTDDGRTLLFDYLFGQWSTFTNHVGLDAAVVGNQYHYLRTDGRVFRETIGEYSDAGTRIKLRLETAWIHLVGHLQGFQRFWYAHFLGTWSSPHQFGIQYQTDYLDGWTETYWHDATGLDDSTGWITGEHAGAIGEEPIIGTSYGSGEYGAGAYGGSVPGLYQWRHHLNEKGQSIRFAVEDFEATGYTGASFELTELLLTGGVIAAAQRPATAARSS